MRLLYSSSLEIGLNWTNEWSDELKITRKCRHVLCKTHKKKNPTLQWEFFRRCKEERTVVFMSWWSTGGRCYLSPLNRNVYKQKKQSWSEVTSLSALLRKPDFALWDPNSDVLDGSPGPEWQTLQQTEDKKKEVTIQQRTIIQPYYSVVAQCGWCGFAQA